MILVIDTQYWENYGAHDWDGKGECPQYWKAKGGSNYKISGAPQSLSYDELLKYSLAVEVNNEYCREQVMGVHFEENTWLSWFEKSQLEWDGEIVHKEPILTWTELLQKNAKNIAFMKDFADQSN